VNPLEVSSFLTIRVADIRASYEQWRARGAEILTEPKDHVAEIRCYRRDSDGYIFEVGQSTAPQGSAMRGAMSEATNWEIDSNGLLVATPFVPFVVWLLLHLPVPFMPPTSTGTTPQHDTHSQQRRSRWQPSPQRRLRALALHEQHNQQEVQGKAASHRAMIAHDRLLARLAGKYQAQSQNIGLRCA
jgi:hypothetical protein